jgi:hypothetical protein
MTATNVFYKVEIDTKDAVQPIIYFRKAKRCMTAKGADRQHNRIVNETVDAWRQFSKPLPHKLISIQSAPASALSSAPPGIPVPRVRW